jgi:hypothetical protein
MDLINQVRSNTTDIKDMIIRTSSKEFDKALTGSDKLGEIAENDEESSNDSDEDPTSSSDDMFDGKDLKEKEKDMNENQG